MRLLTVAVVAASVASLALASNCQAQNRPHHSETAWEKEVEKLFEQFPQTGPNVLKENAQCFAKHDTSEICLAIRDMARVYVRHHPDKII